MVTPANIIDPFICGRPVKGDEFINREVELRTVFSRIRNRESTTVVGEPRIGKTSFLLRLADSTVQQHYLGAGAGQLTTIRLDLHYITKHYTPGKFWRKALSVIKEHPGHVGVSRRIPRVALGESDADALNDALTEFFEYFAAQDRFLVLLMDEFERLLDHPNFTTHSFFTNLRSLATVTGGLVLIPASRLSVAQMNERGRRILDIGSDFFNNHIELRLLPFSDQDSEKLFNRAGNALSFYERSFARRVAGNHPYLLQGMASALLETTGDDYRDRAAERFYDRISSHFDELWDNLDDKTRTTAVILSLVQLGGRALGNDFSFGEIEHVDAFGPELQRLADLGFAKRIWEGKALRFDPQTRLVWRDEQWTISAEAFIWWVRDVVIAQVRHVPAYDEWLANKRYHLLLTQGQWDSLVSAVRNALGWVGQGVRILARSLFEELTRRA